MTEKLKWRPDPNALNAPFGEQAVKKGKSEEIHNKLINSIKTAKKRLHNVGRHNPRIWSLNRILAATADSTNMVN